MRKIKSLFTLAVLISMASLDALAYDIAVKNRDGITIYYNYINGNKELEVSGHYIGYSGDLVIPEVVLYGGNTYKVTGLSDNVFEGNNHLTSVVIPNSVKSIPGNTFYGCSKLQSVSLPNNLQMITYGMFNSCSSLISIDIPSSVKSIGRKAFAYCKKLKSIKLPESVVYIGESAFDGCSNLSTIDISESVVSIGEYAFDDTGWLNNQPDGLVYIGKVAYKYKGKMPNNTHLVIKKGTKGIAGSAFNDPNLISITIPNTINYIGEYAFEGCTNLSTIDIPESVVSIGYCAFSGCINLSTIDIPESVVSIGAYAFGFNDSNYTAWYKNQPEGLVYAGKVAYIYKGAMPAETEIVLKEGTLGIADGAFASTGNLTSITIPQSVINIGASAFQGCSGLKSLLLPEKIEKIGSNAFENCTNLRSLIIPNGNVELGNNFFSQLDFLEFIGTEEFLDCAPIDATLLRAVDSLVVPAKTYMHLSENNYWYNSNHIFARGFNGELCVGILNLYTNNISINGNTKDTLVFVPSHAKAIIQRTNSSPTEMYVTINGQSTILTPENDKTEIFPISYHSHLCNIVYAVDRNISGDNEYTISVASSGTLLSQIGRNNLEKVKRLKVIGDINGTDILAIRKMSTLEELDLSEANIVNGGSSYLTEYTTSANEIGAYFFKDISNLIVLHLPESGKQIKRNVFDGCIKLQEVIVPGSFTGIEENAFSNSGVKKVVFKDSESSIFINKTAFANTSISFLEFYRDYETRLSSGDSNYIFGSKGSLKLLTIDGHSTKVNDHVFTNCNTLSSLIIGSKVKRIGESNFANCAQLEKVIFKDSETKLELSGAWSTSYPQGFGFFGNSPIKELYCGRNISNQYGTFMNLPYLTDLTISEHVTEIVRGQFKNDIGLKKVILPNSIRYIEANAFGGCASLAELSMPSQLNTIGDEAFANCECLKNIEIPASVTKIGSQAFENCKALTTIYIGDNVSSIYNRTFKGCSSLQEIRLGEKITSIGSNAFDDCSKITTFYSLNSTPPTVNSTSLSGINRSACTLYVPKGAGDIYWLHPEWEAFFDIKEVEPTSIKTTANDVHSVTSYYTLDGKKIDVPKKGINIYKMNNGSYKKVYVK